MRNILAVLLLFSIVYPVHAMSSSVSEKLTYIDYKVRNCTPRDTGVSFWFTTDDKKSRHFALSNADKKLLLSFSGGKGSMDWSAVEIITYLKLSDNEGYVSIVYKEKKKFLSGNKTKSLEFGVMNMDCWEILTKNVGSEIPTEIKQ
ncbi:MAG: hypothetical protein GY820_11250 [Gammaproteobacteria bacterium]|nr:hypothetical protein [Gammaproteobacteria bacterium]